MRRNHVFDGGDSGALITALTGIEIRSLGSEGQSPGCTGLRTARWSVPR
jgi:hypothetical protein